MRDRYRFKLGRNKRSKISILILIMFVGLLSNACHLPIKGLAQPIDSWEVTQYFCLGDPIDVSWNLQPGFNRRNCTIRCETPSDCMVGSICVDGFCMSRIPPGSATPPDGQCVPNTELTITSSEGSELVSHTHEPSGSRTLTPSDSVTFAATGGYRYPLRFYTKESKTATLVTPSTESIIGIFPFVCPVGWGSYDIVRDGPTVSEHVVIAGVTNNSGGIIDLSGPNHFGPPVRLVVGEETDAFNGKVAGEWRASIPYELRVSLPTPQCIPTAIENSYPDLSVKLRLTCAATN